MILKLLRHKDLRLLHSCYTFCKLQVAIQGLEPPPTPWHVGGVAPPSRSEKKNWEIGCKRPEKKLGGVGGVDMISWQYQIGGVIIPFSDARLG